MSATLQDAAAPQAAVEAARGLPFWIFWLLLCVILLLLAVIFLRDKDLRRKMSAFLSGTRRRMLRLRLQSRLNREKEKKTALWKELGKRAWSEDVTAESVAEECRKLAALEEEVHDHQMAWHEIYSRIETIGREHEQKAERFRAAIRDQDEARKPSESERRRLAARRSEILDAIGGRDAGKAVDALRRNIEGGRTQAENAVKEALANAYDIYG